MSFSCAYLSFEGYQCLKLTGACNPGRKGCQVGKKVRFPVKETGVIPTPVNPLKEEFGRKNRQK